MRRESLLGGFVTAIAGLVVGVVIGTVPIGLQFYSYLTECTAFTTEAACGALTASSCVWNATTSHCLYPDHLVVDCTAFTAKDPCQDAGPDGSCFFDEKDKKCKHSHGWAPWKQGLFAGGYIVGAMFTSLIGGAVTELLGRRRALMLSGFLGLAATAVSTYGWFHEMSLVLLCVGQVLAGMVCGLVSVAGPMYCGEVAPPEVADSIGMSFQVASTFGIFLPALAGFFLDPSQRYHISSSTQAAVPLEQTFQLVLVVQWVASAAVFMTGMFVPESPKWLEARKKPTGIAPREGFGLVNAANEFEGEEMTTLLTYGDSGAGSGLFTRANAAPLLVATAMAAAQQLTGINSIMAFAPEITGNMGLRPLLGNLLIMAWNFITTLPALPAAKKWAPDRMYVAATSAACATCLLTGIAAFPGIIEGNDTLRNTLSIVGIVGYIAAFEIGIGPPFFVLAQSIFPDSSRAAGCAYAIWIQYVMNVIINWGYPVAQTALSGGPSGNQDQGLAICFLIFSFFGLVCAISLKIGFKKLYAGDK